MQELNKYLDTFNIIIKDLSEYQPNVRLGGTLVLKLLGLNFSRSVGDLDIIIVNPTKEQKTYLKGLKFFNINSSSPGDYNFKFKKSDLYLNILCVDNYTGNIGSIHYTYKNIKYQLVPINEIIEAKKKYARKKDLQDFIMLKNENFNI
jgi:hypothetical protein